MSKKTYDDAVRTDEGWKLAPEDIVIIGLDTNDGPEHPLYDERIELPLQESFVANIKKVGILQKPLCTPVKLDGKTKPAVVDGRQRVRAARQANIELAAAGEPLQKIVISSQRGNDEHLAGKSLSANTFRQDDSQSVKARKVQRLLDRGMSNAETAEYLGVTTQSIANWTKILELASPVLKAVDNGQITASAASKLHDLNRDEQVEKLKELLASSNGKRPTGKKAAAAASSGKSKEGKKTPSIAPGKRIARKMVKAHVDGNVDFVSEEFLHGVQWAIGDITDEDIKGMTKFIENAD